MMSDQLGVGVEPQRDLHADLERAYAKTAAAIVNWPNATSLDWQLGYSRCMEDTFAVLRALDV